MLEASLEGSAETWFAFCFLVVPRGMQGLKSPPSHPPPPTRDRTVPAAVEARSPKHWTAREVPGLRFKRLPRLHMDTGKQQGVQREGQTAARNGRLQR